MSLTRTKIRAVEIYQPAGAYQTVGSPDDKGRPDVVYEVCCARMKRSAESGSRLGRVENEAYLPIIIDVEDGGEHDHSKQISCLCSKYVQVIALT